MTDAQRERKDEGEPIFFVFCLATAALIAETEAGLALISPPDFATTFIVHTFTVFLLGLAVLNLAHTRRNYRFSLLLLLACAALGPFGALLGVLSIAAYSLVNHSRDPMTWIDAFFPPPDVTEETRLRSRLALGLGMPCPKGSVEPFQDILVQGTLFQKRDALAKMTRYFRPAFTPLLLQAARSDEPAVRVQAATALAHIERDFMAKRMRLEKEVRRFPALSSELELAQLYDDYAFSGLADEDSSFSLREKAISIYARHLERHEDGRVLACLARLYARQGLDEKAINILSGPALSGALPPETASWYMECLFRQRRLEELRRFAARSGIARRSISAFSKLDDVFPVWGEKDVA